MGRMNKKVKKTRGYYFWLVWGGLYTFIAICEGMDGPLVASYISESISIFCFAMFTFIHYFYYKKDD